MSSNVQSDRNTSRSVALFHNGLTRFVEIDCELLRKLYLLTIHLAPSPWNMNLARIWKIVRRHDLVFCWFAGWHSLGPVILARLLGKPSVVVVGGYDTANLPEAGYGSQRGGLRKIIARLTMKLATHLIANSYSAGSEAIATLRSAKQKISIIYHGVPLPGRPAVGARQPMALTVGNVWRENLLRKGLLPFVRAAKHLPNVRFVHVGAWKDGSIDQLRREAGPNVEFLGFVSNDSLKELYDQASVYVQASLHEGFGLSLAEGMAAGCIPVATRVGAIPEVVGDTGIYLSNADPLGIARGVTSALRCTYPDRLKAHTRVQEKFSLEQRERSLKTVLDYVMLAKAPADESGLAAEPAQGSARVRPPSAKSPSLVPEKSSE